MRQEAAMLTRLQHPLIVTFYGLAIDATRVHLVQELCPHTLQDTPGVIMQGKGRCVHFLAPVAFMAQPRSCVCSWPGMAFVHSCGLIHRDLKPANVFLESADFEALCTTKMREQWRNQSGPRKDWRLWFITILLNCQ